MSDLTLIIISVLISGILSGVAGFVIKLVIDQRSQIASKNKNCNWIVKPHPAEKDYGKVSAKKNGRSVAIKAK